MIHKPIQLIDISLLLPHKTCFEDFTAVVPYGSRIAIIGRNGSGKTTLLKILQGLSNTSSGKVIIPEDVRIGHVPQVAEGFDSLSGGQRFNAAMTKSIAVDPNVLLLDEPTNHLDKRNRKSLMHMLNAFPGTLIIISHDPELLRNCIDTIWHIDCGKIHVFSGKYDDYMQEIRIKRASIERELSRVTRQKKSMHEALMVEQERARKSAARGRKSISERKWPTVVSGAKATRAEETSGRKRADISNRKQDLIYELAELRLPEIILPKFSLDSAELGKGIVVSITGGSVGYEDNFPITQGINLSVKVGDRLAVTGDNGSGKSTLIKAIIGRKDTIKLGNWYVPKIQDIGYLDQNYDTLNPNKSVLESIAELIPNWTHAEIRCHLNDFLFRKNEEVNVLVANLSGGEKVRLSLAQIAAVTPKLLVLDEITNNLDLETRAHVIEVLKRYPGAMIVISHDEDFLTAINIDEYHAIMV